MAAWLNSRVNGMPCQLLTARLVALAERRDEIDQPRVETIMLLQISINTGGSVACIDGALASNPTCGWAYTVSGSKVANSQGFCCQCSFSQLTGDATTRE